MGELNFNTLAVQGIKCRAYFNDDNDQGVEVSVNEEYLGKMIGVILPCTNEDEENGTFDDEEYTLFICEVENWIIDNE
jgi:hypothetical protein